MMTYDWQDTLLGEGDLARRAAAMVPRMLAHPAVTLDQVSRLRGHIDDCIGRLGILLVEMQNAEADQVFVEAARTIRDACRALLIKPLSEPDCSKLASLTSVLRCQTARIRASPRTRARRD